MGDYDRDPRYDRNGYDPYPNYYHPGGKPKKKHTSESMVIGTSAIVDTEIDGAVGMNSGIFNNPFMIWGKYRKEWLAYKLPVSFQFHHTQMDGAHAGRFLGNPQREIKNLK